MHSIPGKIRKLMPPINSKKFPWTLKNCTALHENQQIFQKPGVSFRKSKDTLKNENFSG